MTDSKNTKQPADQAPTKSLLARLLEQHRWIAMVAPLAVYMLVTQLEPKPPVGSGEDPTVVEQADPDGAEEGNLESDGVPITYDHYPLIYTLKIALTLITVVLVLPYWSGISWRLSPLAVAVGAVGTVIWVVLVDLRLEVTLLSKVELESYVEGTRSAFNPLTELSENPAWMYGFLAVRFFGLALLVPVIEEIFLRGFLMRFFTQIEWWTMPLTQVSFSAVAFTTLLAVSMHPGELLAELVWFSMVTLLMLRTGNLCDCIVAHGVTNLLLGIYVLATGKWYFM